jgi:hypothetical protein
MYTWILWAVLVAAGGPDVTAAAAQEPVTFEFLRMAGPADGRKEAFDPVKRVYFLKVHDIGRFRVKAVAADLDTQPVILRITGMLDKPEGPLVLEADGKTYSLYHEGYDKELFKIERQAGVTTIEFLPRGKKLLKPGASFLYIDYYRN